MANDMMNDMMMGGMTWGMGILGILLVIVLILAIAALVKYLPRRLIAARAQTAGNLMEDGHASSDSLGADATSDVCLGCYRCTRIGYAALHGRLGIGVMRWHGYLRPV